MTHTQTIIGIIITAGLLGGLTNFFLFLDTEYSKKECWISFFKSVLLSLCASITVPLFLQIISNNLLEVQKDTPFPDKNYFILFSFCVLAALFSKRFLEDLYAKVSKAQKKAEEAKEISQEAKNKVKENEKEIKDTQKLINYNEEINAAKDIIINQENVISNTESIVRGHIDEASTMLGVATGTTFDDNFKYDIYYDPAARSHGYTFKYIGLYKSWGIRGVGEVSKIVYCDYDTEEDMLISTKKENLDVFRSLTKDEIKRIKDVINDTKYYDLETGNKFFLVDKFYPTKYMLDSPIMGKQYFWLNEFSNFKKNMSAEDLANLLSTYN